MDVIVHEHIGVDPAVLLVCVMTQQTQVGDAVAIREEHRLAIVAALDDMLRVSGRIDPSGAWHERFLGLRGQSPLLHKGI
jgi:hypothetical protein